MGAPGRWAGSERSAGAAAATIPAMARSTGDGTQLSLPFPVSTGARVRRVARRTGGVLGRVLQVALRWLLRLALPLICAAALLQAFPYTATVQGVPFQVQGSLFSRPGLSADTTLGSWRFPEVSGVPFGVHVSPEDVDVLQLAGAANGDVPAFVERLQAEFTDQLPHIAGWLIGELLLGLAIGLAIAAAINMSVRYLRGRPRRAHELRHRSVQAGVAVAVTAAVVGYGALSYNPNWVRESRLTGTFAAAQLFPGELSQYYDKQSKALSVLGSVLGIQAALQAQIEDDRTPDTALRIMTISDLHLSANYPLVAQYAANYDVDLIVNSGDEAMYGTREEMMPAYLDSIRALTATTPMLWIAGNHDSPATMEIMRTIPGVTVLGTKTADADGAGYTVTAGLVRAYGLTIAGLSDPRVYGGPGAYGDDKHSVVDPLERESVVEALGGEDAGSEDAGSEDAGSEDAGSEDADATGAPTTTGAPADGTAPATTDATATGTGTGTTDATGTTAATADGDGAADPGTELTDPPDAVDIFAIHEPVAAEVLRDNVAGQVRQTLSGHVHAQNDNSELQGDGTDIDLVEGTTGAGGLGNIVRGTSRPPIEFSIESVAADCQFTRIIRFSITAAAETGTLDDAGGTTPQSYGDDVTASTVYFRPQQVAEDRSCGTELGIGAEQPWPRADG